MSDSSSDSTDSTVKHLIFTHLFRSEIAEELGFTPDPKTKAAIKAGGDEAEAAEKRQTQERLAFLKRIDWNDTDITDKITRLYLTRMGNIIYDALKEKLPGQLQKSNLVISWGSPQTSGEQDQLVRPQLRIQVINEDTPEEAYRVTYTPPEKEAPASNHTQAFIHALHRVMKLDLQLDLAKPHIHTIETPPHIETGDHKVHFIGSNMYEHEGANMDIVIPAKAFLKSLQGMISKGTLEARSLTEPWTKRAADFAAGSTPLPGFTPS